MMEAEGRDAEGLDEKSGNMLARAIPNNCVRCTRRCSMRRHLRAETRGNSDRPRSRAEAPAGQRRRRAAAPAGAWSGWTSLARPSCPRPAFAGSRNPRAALRPAACLTADWRGAQSSDRGTSAIRLRKRITVAVLSPSQKRFLHRVELRREQLEVGGVGEFRDLLRRVSDRAWRYRPVSSCGSPAPGRPACNTPRHFQHSAGN